MQDPAALERENRLLERRLRRLESNVKQLESFQDSNSTLLSRLLADLETEKARSQRLLLNVLPQRIVDRLNAGETEIADRHEDTTVLFSDFVGFTGIASTLPAAELVEELNALFRAFDAACEANGIEKIKTVGDAYLAVGGISGNADDGMAGVAETALAMLDAVDGGVASRADWRIRIGIHAGPIVAGIVGVSKFAYDVWGDTVNVASRLETTSEPGRIHVSNLVAARLADRFTFEPRGSVDLKGKGAMETSFLLGRRPG
ncbi:MAG TPA: adenylate/guanylate cyclase domain-containing protein [Candidatus Limnocylindrales bacterium]|jgi:class 3 adenylate cyclase|nr:adenylate/guanylate cyclase domain-containing protein [Candidatus Limnocylindrales bacterium]